MNVRPHALLGSDLEGVVQHYKSIRPELANDLLDEYVQGIQKIIQHPNAWPLISRGVRRYRLPTFPYGITYLEKDGVIALLAFVHLHRKPGLWRERLKS